MAKAEGCADGKVAIAEIAVVMKVAAADARRSHGHLGFMRRRRSERSRFLERNDYLCSLTRGRLGIELPDEGPLVHGAAGPCSIWSKWMPLFSDQFDRIEEIQIESHTVAAVASNPRVEYLIDGHTYRQ